STNFAITKHCKNGQLHIARNLFDKMPQRTVVSWNSMISGYSKRANFIEALGLVSLMHRANVQFDQNTFSTSLSVCANLQSLTDGKLIHSLLLKSGSENFEFVGSTLLHFYASNFQIEEAKKVFDELHDGNELLYSLMLVGYVRCNLMSEAFDLFMKIPEWDVRAWTTLISGYAKSEDGCEKALELFCWMRRCSEVMPNEFTLDSVVRACSKIGYLREGRAVHGVLEKFGCEFDPSVGSALIEFYCNCKAIDDAMRVYNRIVNLNPVTWNSLMSGYIQNGRHEEVLQLYVTMRRLSIDSTRSTFSVLFHACSCLGSLQQGQLLHAHMLKTPFESNVYAGTSLTDMYSKCGSILDAQKSFASISSPNVAAWTAIINGYALHGLGSEAILLFEHMLEQGVVPNAATFVGLLSACGRAGLVNEGMEIFHSMQKHYGVVPALEHYCCVVDLLSRSGHLHEAERFIIEMPIEADGVVWGALINACWFWMNMEVGERVAERMHTMDPKPTFAYVIMSNIYAKLGKWGEKMNMRKRLKGLEVKKDPGYSWIELNSRVHVFFVEDKTHSDCNMIYETLEHL
ncbi:PPR domain-containing protein/PPR_2 domain-containing protein, partial [Cephalotus follicularis]